MRSFKLARPWYCGVVAMVAATTLSFGLEPQRELIEGLGAEAYPERIAAEKALQSWVEREGEAAKEWLLLQHKQSENPEIRRGALSVLRSVVMKDLVNQRPGFVGIGMGSVKLADDSEFKGYGIVIQTVNAGTPAEKAGLRVTDVILKLDGKGWAGEDAQHEFAGRIGNMRGGDKIRLELLRDGKKEVVELTLAPRPWAAGIYDANLQQRTGVFALRSSRPEDEERAENAAFQEWMKRRQAEIPER